MNYKTGELLVCGTIFIAGLFLGAGFERSVMSEDEHSCCEACTDLVRRVNALEQISFRRGVVR